MTKPDGNDLLTLGLDDFARLFGTTVDTISEDCRKLINSYDFHYRKLSAPELAKVEGEIQQFIDSGEFSLAGKEGKARWEKGWGENLNDLIAAGGDITQLVPKYIRKYIRPNQLFRLDQTYVLPVDPNFELNWFEVFRLWLCQTYLKDFSTVYEFGCGSGFNLVALANLYPDKQFYGLDWAEPSCNIVNKLAEVYHWKMKGRNFDFFAPDQSFKIAPNSAVLTIGALEQTGRDWEKFLQYLLEQRPALVVHAEPICEWYDESNTSDRLAAQLHRKRKYWEGFPPKLQALHALGKVEILKMKRAYFGSQNIEGYSQLIWRPK